MEVAACLIIDCCWEALLIDIGSWLSWWLLAWQRAVKARMGWDGLGNKFYQVGIGKRL